MNKQNFELNIISEYKLFIAEKDNDIYITVEDTELVISDLFENNIPKGTYNTGPRKYQKLSDFGLYVFRKIFQNSEIDLEFERVKKEVSFINQVCFPKLEPYFTATNSQLKKKIESECSPDDKYSFLSDVEKEYICYVTKLNYVVEITKTSNLSDSSELTELILSTDDKKTSENYVAKYINVNEINNSLPGKTYHMKEVYEFSHKVDHDYVDFWPKFFKSISSK